MGDPRTYHFKLPGPFPGAILPEPPNSIFPGIQPLWPQITQNRLLRSDGKIRAFVIHATAGSSSQGAMSVMFERRASFHWLIPDENEPEHGRFVWATAPERRAASHVRNSKFHQDVNNGSRNVNFWSLGLEIVNSQVGDPYSNWQVEQAAALVRYAWSKNPELRDVVSHAKLDPLRRSDPGSDFPWDQFKELVFNPPAQPVAPEPPLHLSVANLGAIEPIRIISPQGEHIECDPRFSGGATVAEVTPLIEALGFRVERDAAMPMTLLIKRGTGSLGATRTVGTVSKSAAKKRGGKKKASSR